MEADLSVYGGELKRTVESLQAARQVGHPGSTGL